VLAVAGVAVLVIAATAEAGGSAYHVHFTPAGQAAARVGVPTKADVGAAWKGGRVKPDLSDDLRCPNYQPKTSDLEMTGAASVKFKQSGIELSGDAQVLRTAKMVRLDWQRSIGSANYLACVRASVTKLFGTGKGKLPGKINSVRWIPLPRVFGSSPAAAVRADFAVETKHNGTVRLVVDVIGIARGKTEIALTTSMPFADVATMWPNELVMAKVVAGRVPA
jgi:hypothetical protein